MIRGRDKDTVKKISSDNFLKEIFKNIFLPDICSSCGDINKGLLCEKCRQEIPEISGIICRNCGTPVFIKNTKDCAVSYNLISTSVNSMIFHTKNDQSSFVLKTPGRKDTRTLCINCRNSEYSFYRLRSFGFYSGILKKLIIKYKYNKIYSLAPVLCSFLKKIYDNCFRNEKIDFVETVPDFTLNANDFKKSFYPEKNHMQILAELFSREVRLPYLNNMIKIRKTLKQHNLGMHERKINLKDTFKARNILKVTQRNILILDDVWTTGNTLNEISRVLKKCGADKIYLLTLARAIW